MRLDVVHLAHRGPYPIVAPRTFCLQGLGNSGHTFVRYRLDKALDGVEPFGLYRRNNGVYQFVPYDFAKVPVAKFCRLQGRRVNGPLASPYLPVYGVTHLMHDVAARGPGSLDFNIKEKRTEGAPGRAFEFTHERQKSIRVGKLRFAVEPLYSFEGVSLYAVRNLRRFGELRGQ